MVLDDDLEWELIMTLMAAFPTATLDLDWRARPTPPGYHGPDMGNCVVCWRTCRRYGEYARLTCSECAS
jgi:hypothetical protein